MTGSPAFPGDEAFTQRLAVLRILAAEQGPDRVEERAGTEQRFETGWRIGLAHA